jgi:hypothetical protein
MTSTASSPARTSTNSLTWWSAAPPVGARRLVATPPNKPPLGEILVPACLSRYARNVTGFALLVGGSDGRQRAARD